MPPTTDLRKYARDEIKFAITFFGWRCDAVASRTCLCRGIGVFLVGFALAVCLIMRMLYPNRYLCIKQGKFCTHHNGLGFREATADDVASLSLRVALTAVANRRCATAAVATVALNAATLFL